MTEGTTNEPMGTLKVVGPLLASDFGDKEMFFPHQVGSSCAMLLGVAGTQRMLAQRLQECSLDESGQHSG